MGWSSNLEVGKGLTIPHHEEPACYEMLHKALGGLLWTQ